MVCVLVDLILLYSGCHLPSQGDRDGCVPFGDHGVAVYQYTIDLDTVGDDRVGARICTTESFFEDLIDPLFAIEFKTSWFSE